MPKKPSITSSLIHILSLAKQPMDLLEIKSKLYDLTLEIPNKTSLYRSLEKLELEELIAKVTVSDSKQYWEIDLTSEKLHFHLICNICNKVECRESVSRSRVPKKFKNFHTNKIELNYFGKCQKCFINNIL